MRRICFLLFSTMLLTKIAGQTTDLNNLFDYNKGARVVAYSSNYGSVWDVEYVLENCPFEKTDIPTWCTEDGAPFPHFVTIEFAKTEWLNIIDLNNNIADENAGWEGISAKDIEVWISTTSKDQGFTKVVNFRLEKNKSHQIVKINPIQAKWVKFVITSNYGNADYTEFGQIGAFDDKQRETNINDEITKNGYVNLYGLYFDFGSDNIKPESLSAIEQVLDYLKKNPSVKIQIEGHTDNIGSDNGNQTLSDKRAIAVKNELVKKGISADRLTTKGFGSKQPITSNSTDIGRAQNRRVTIRKV
jgi:outer membrane protein OmpA-like peptidoglycan-associated protein